MPKFSKRSLDNLKSCDPALQAVAELALILGPIDFMVTCGHRGQAEQDRCFAAGTSKLKWPNGKHNKMPSLAMDCEPWPIDYQNSKRYEELGSIIQAAAKDLGVALAWGGNWHEFLDLPHYELARPSGWTRDKDGRPVAPNRTTTATIPPIVGQHGPQKISAKGINLVMQFEGLYLTAYYCPAQVPTIGYGHTAGIKAEDVGKLKITSEQAVEYLREDLAGAEADVLRIVKVPLNQGEFDALVSFVFNLGAGSLQKSTLLKKLNARDYAGAAAEFNKWCKAGGVQLMGLVRRRAAERKLFEEGGI